jgi:hypothetical protein
MQNQIKSSANTLKIKLKNTKIKAQVKIKNSFASAKGTTNQILEET